MGWSVNNLFNERFFIISCAAAIALAVFAAIGQNLLPQAIVLRQFLLLVVLCTIGLAGLILSLHATREIISNTKYHIDVINTTRLLIGLLVIYYSIKFIIN